MITPKLSEVDGVDRTDEFEFLDELRESGVTNMYGAGPYLVDEFGHDHEAVEVIVLAWMRTFSERHGK